MKITTEHASGRDIIETLKESVSITAFGIYSGDMLIAEMNVEMGSLVWTDTNGRNLGSITVEP